MKDPEIDVMTQDQAIQLANAFVETHPYPEDYTLEFGSIYEVGGKYYLRYTKVFKEPRKENPPYRLVIVEPTGAVSWGKP